MDLTGQDILNWFNLSFVPGLVLGCIYALGAIGISLVFSILRFAHFAHGDVLTLGAFLALAIVGGAGIDPILALPLAAILTAWIFAGIPRLLLPDAGAKAALPVVAVLAALGTVILAFAFDMLWVYALLLSIPLAFLLVYGMDGLFYRPLRTAKPIVLLIASIGIALMMRSIIQVIWGPDVNQYATGIERPLEALRPLSLKLTHLYIFAATIILVSATHYLLAYTRIGKAMRATSDDPDLARVAGINTERVILWTWIVAAVLAAGAGVLIGMDTNVKPMMGFNLLLPMFAAAILGGLGRPYGAIAGGLIIGMLEEISTWYYFDTQLVSGDYKSAVAFGIMVLMLIFRPTGLFKGRVL